MRTSSTFVVRIKDEVLGSLSGGDGGDGGATAVAAAGIVWLGFFSRTAEQQHELRWGNDQPLYYSGDCVGRRNSIKLATALRLLREVRWFRRHTVFNRAAARRGDGETIS